MTLSARILSAWNEARATLANYDPMRLVSDVSAKKVLLSTGVGDKDYYDGLAAGLAGQVTVGVNLGKGHLDHIAQEDWLANACDVKKGPAHYPRTS